MNNDFLVTRDVICQWFSRVAKSREKIIDKSLHSWPNIVIHGNSCIVLYMFDEIFTVAYLGHGYKQIRLISPGEILIRLDRVSCHVGNFVAITSLEFGWEQNEISITFECDEILLVKWAPYIIIWSDTQWKTNRTPFTNKV